MYSNAMTHPIICRNTRPPLRFYNNLYNSAYKSAIVVVVAVFDVALAMRLQLRSNACLCRYVHTCMQQQATVNCRAATKKAQNKIMACIKVL